MRIVGPVLVGGPTTRAVLAAIEELNGEATIVDRQGYVRVRVPVRCVVTRAAIEQHLGRPFEMRTELEPLLASFVGRMTLDPEQVTWE
jgi:toluene monooxygenase system protein D